jgi:hypothetical protein
MVVSYRPPHTSMARPTNSGTAELGQGTTAGSTPSPISTTRAYSFTTSYFWLSSLKPCGAKGERELRVSLRQRDHFIQCRGLGQPVSMDKRCLLGRRGPRGRPTADAHHVHACTSVLFIFPHPLDANRELGRLLRLALLSLLVDGHLQQRAASGLGTPYAPLSSKQSLQQILVSPLGTRSRGIQDTNPTARARGGRLELCVRVPWCT